MHERALATYRADNSGPNAKPFPGSTVKENNRVDYLTHEGFKRALNGPGLAPMTKRYMVFLERKLDDFNFTNEWLDVPDLLEFFRMVHGAALLEVVFGPSLCKVNPTFLRDLWYFDDSVPLLARILPSLFFPKVYRVRKSLRAQFKKWYAYARKKFSQSCIGEDGDGDPYWGSELIRYQQRMYLAAEGYDDDALAAADLALVWGYAIMFLLSYSQFAILTFVALSAMRYPPRCFLYTTFSRTNHSCSAYGNVSKTVSATSQHQQWIQPSSFRTRCYHLFKQRHFDSMSISASF